MGLLGEVFYDDRSYYVNHINQSYIIKHVFNKKKTFETKHTCRDYFV